MEKIRCSKCNEFKETSEFNVVKNRGRGFHIWCRSCLKEYDHNRHQSQKIKRLQQKKDRRNLLREWMIEKKSNLKCSKCPEDTIECLDFHHINPEEKDFCISEMINKGFSIENMEKEIKKCIVLCSNCHRKVHAGLFSI